MLAASTLSYAGWLLRGPAVFLAVLGAGLCTLAVGGLVRPSERHDWLLFKAASVYMAASFGCLVVGAALAAG